MFREVLFPFVRLSSSHHVSQASWWCGPIMVEACNITLGGGSLKGFDFTALMEESDSLSLSWEPMSSASPNYQLLTSAYLSESLNTTALAELDLTPEGGVSASTGYITVRSVSVALRLSSVAKEL